MKLEHCFRNPRHPLILRERKMIDEQVMRVINCQICKRVISEAEARLYVCDSCKYYLHESCTELPDQINHSFHPSHPLTVDPMMFSWCDSCYKSSGNYATFYTCSKCRFDMDMECALMPTTPPSCGDEGQRWILHASHPHSLSLAERDDSKDQPVQCFACKSTCSSGLAYACTSCDYFLHESCAEFPSQIRHPFHRHHGLLALRVVSGGSYECSLHKQRLGGRRHFLFRCDQCDYHLCWMCAINKERRGVVYEHHEHNLYFCPEMGTELGQCSGYDAYCRQQQRQHSAELSRAKSSILECSECDFKVHTLCGPLPSTIKYERHIHRLTLVDSLVEDDSGEYYCDACETERDPRIRLYYCGECKYFAHVHCVIPEIVKALKEDDDVELKIREYDIWKLPFEMTDNTEVPEEKHSKSRLTLRDLINKLSAKEQSELEVYYKWNNVASLKSHLTTQPQDVDQVLKLFRFTDSFFRSFFDDELHKFCGENKLEFKSSDLALKTVNVEGYTIPYTVEPVMRALLHRYGDVSVDDTDSRELKSIVYFVLCEVVRKMGSTLVIDLTKSVLQQWYYHLRFVKKRGFKVDFACARLERLVRAFLGLQSNKLQDEIPALINEKILKLQGEIVEENKKIAKLQQAIIEEKSKLEICRAYPGSSAKSKFMIDCLQQASDMKWKKACDQDSFFDCDQGSAIYKSWND